MIIFAKQNKKCNILQSNKLSRMYSLYCIDIKAHRMFVYWFTTFIKTPLIAVECTAKMLSSSHRTRIEVCQIVLCIINNSSYSLRNTCLLSNIPTFETKYFHIIRNIFYFLVPRQSKSLVRWGKNIATDNKTEFLITYRLAFFQCMLHSESKSTV